ncbi:MAG: hypothetical protein HY290_10985 [Planctomycetia bacterium]|nr:hypothetical protein [Planctomycetia bacterium]
MSRFTTAILPLAVPAAVGVIIFASIGRSSRLRRHGVRHVEWWNGSEFACRAATAVGVLWLLYPPHPSGGSAAPAGVARLRGVRPEGPLSAVRRAFLITVHLFWENCRMSAEFKQTYVEVASYLRRVFLMPTLSGFADSLPPSAPQLSAPAERNEPRADGADEFFAASHFIPSAASPTTRGPSLQPFLSRILRRLLGPSKRDPSPVVASRGELVLRISGDSEQLGIEITCEVKCPNGGRLRSPAIRFPIDGIDEPALSDWLVTTLPIAYGMLSANTQSPASFAAASDSERWAVVLGSEMAAAAAAEQRRRHSGVVHESPLPADDYDFWRGDFSLIDPAPNSLDDALRNVARRYAESDPEQRSDFRDSISMDGFYTLMTFARRSVVSAMRSQRADLIRDGLTAVAMISQERVDYRDILVCLSLLYHAANRVGANADSLFRQTARLAKREVGKLFVEFTRQTAEYRNLQSSWGYDEIQTENGVGFIGWEFAEYAPDVDLKSVALQVSRLIAADKYQPDSVSVAAELPPFWLSRGENPELEQVLARVRGGASISARLRPGEHGQHDSQQFSVFIVETSAATDAQKLLRLSQVKEVRDHSMTGAATGKLFALIVARAFMEGAQAFETPSSLARFEKGLAETLARFAT